MTPDKSYAARHWERGGDEQPTKLVPNEKLHLEDIYTMTRTLHEQKQLTFLNLFNEKGSIMCEKSFDLVLDLIHKHSVSKSDTDLWTTDLKPHGIYLHLTLSKSIKTNNAIEYACQQ